MWAGVCSCAAQSPPKLQDQGQHCGPWLCKLTYLFQQCNAACSKLSTRTDALSAKDNSSRLSPAFHIATSRTGHPVCGCRCYPTPCRCMSSAHNQQTWMTRLQVRLQLAILQACLLHCNAQWHVHQHAQQQQQQWWPRSNKCCTSPFHVGPCIRATAWH